MTKQQIIDYIMDSPENTNPAILNQMIDEVSGGGSGDINIFMINESFEPIEGTINGTYTLDKTWQEINDVYMGVVPNTIAVIKFDNTETAQFWPVISMDTINDSNYILNTMGRPYSYETSNPNGYPYYYDNSK